MTQQPLPPRHHGEDALSRAMEDYLKVVYRLEEAGRQVTTAALAEQMSVAPASATHMIKRLAARGFVLYKRYHGVQLSDAGREVAAEMIRHHRLLELYLQRALGFSADDVHVEAERLEHFISEALEDRIDLVLGGPVSDPHGSAIPARPRAPARENEECSLAQLELYRPATVVSCPPELQAAGVAPGSTVTLLGRPPGAQMHVRVGEQERLLEPALAPAVRVVRR